MPCSDWFGVLVAGPPELPGFAAVAPRTQDVAIRAIKT
jgi:hypothetical protein